MVVYRILLRLVASIAVHRLALLILILSPVSISGPRALARDNTDPVNIAIIASSDLSRCFSPGVTDAIKHFTQERADQINARGGLAGRKIITQYYDHYRDVSVLQTQVSEILKDPNLAAIIGISNSSRGATVIESIGRSGVPLVSGMSRDDVFAHYGNAFSLSPAVSDEIAAVRTFIKGTGHQRPFFVGLAGDFYAEQYAQELVGSINGVNSLWLAQRPDGEIDESGADKAVDAILKQDSDVIYLGIHSGPGGRFLRRMQTRGIERPVFVVLGRIGRMQSVISPHRYNAEMYQLAREQVPHVYNERLEQLIWSKPDARWIFEDKRAKDAPGHCQSLDDPVKITDVRNLANRRAIGRGTQYADILSLIAEAAAQDTSGTIKELRARIIEGMADLQPTKRIFRGVWQDWSFTESRAVAEDILILQKPADSSDIALAPLQFRQGRQSVISIPVIYTGMDVTRIFQVDSNEKTFHAEFYLSLRSTQDIDFSDIEFTNAFRSPLSNEPVISYRTIEGDERARRRDDPSALDPIGSEFRLYKVTGRFYFDPDLRKFPFDRQRLSISIQPKYTARPFLIQPPPQRLRKASFNIDNWKLESQYVGLDHDIITVIGEQASSQYLIPLTTFNFTWTAKRLATDHYLQVMVPLFIILLVTWLSTFIPAQRLESVVAIQVTALLSSIALYLAVPKVDFDHATVSDIMFVVTYLAISMMLGTSILRTNLAAWRLRRTAQVLGYLQMLAMPVMLALVGEYLIAQNSVSGQSVLGT
ncbi:MAG: ABC transporter substrate-binding protein, partial [Alphaproteobacteria bacterium]|nr:ABC transporter substrate-binding protein [Alphaproteobacteria bacterium]